MVLEVIVCDKEIAFMSFRYAGIRAFNFFTSITNIGSPAVTENKQD